MFLRHANVGCIAIIFFISALGTASSQAAIWTDPAAIDVNVIEGCTSNDTLTIGNNGAENLNFKLRTRRTSFCPLGGSSAAGTAAVVETSENNKIVLEFQFSEPVIKKIDNYDSVEIPSLENYLRIAAPIIPVRPVTVLVPFGKKVVDIHIFVLQTHQLPGTYNLPPAQQPYPTSYTGTIQKTLPDPEIYNLTTPWPDKKNQRVGTHSKRGYQLFTLNLFPIQYTPADGIIIYTPRLRLEILLADYLTTDKLNPSEKTKQTIRSSVENPDTINTYPHKFDMQNNNDIVPAFLSGDPYEYVIITNETLEAASGPWNFQVLRDEKIAQGMTAKIITTEWIYANYSGIRPDGGSDNQTKIRNFLYDAYQYWNTEYAILGGTDSIVPARFFWVEAWSGGSTTTMPSDLYYGCVVPQLCTFDYDADGVYGEPTDGVGGADVDLYADIYIGRACVENVTDVTNFVKKTLTYDSTEPNDTYLPNITMLAEYMGDGVYAKPYMEQIRLGGNYDGYFTYGFENHVNPALYDFNTAITLYAKDQTWYGTDLIDLMNQNIIHAFSHLGHANYTYDMKLSVSDLSSLTNTRYFFAYSQGCNPGGFDYTNCFAEVITAMEYGAFAVIMNARSGWYREESTDGPSHRFNRQFWDAVLNEDMPELGRANQDSKEDNLWDLGGNCIRWCYYELNLFGDPAQQFKFEPYCPWFDVQPKAGTVSPSGSDDVDLDFDAIHLSPGTYNAEIVILANDPCTPKIIPVNMNVVEDDLQITPPNGIDSLGTQNGPFEPNGITYTFTNNGTESVNWITYEVNDWLNVEPNQGIISPSQSVDVNVTITTAANLLDPNIYIQTLTFQNTNSNSLKFRPVNLTVKFPDRFTEYFNSTADLKRITLTLTPEDCAAAYEACRQRANEFPTDPAPGTFVPLSDDDFAEVILTNDANVILYGSYYDRFYISSNGYITFGTGDTASSPTFDNHFNLPRISALFTDLDPPGESVSYKQLDDRVAVTFQDVPLAEDANEKNSFQIELFFDDGTIQITWLDITDTASVIGLSDGRSIIDQVLFEESDLSDCNHCYPIADFSKDFAVNFNDFAFFADYWLSENCNIPLWCAKTDLDFSGQTDHNDIDIIAQNWLYTDYYWLEPFAHWTFDEAQGDIAKDYAGLNDGDIKGDPNWVTGKIDETLDFDGNGDYVDFGDIDALEFGNNDFSFSFWFYTQGTHDAGGGYGAILSKYNYSIGRQWLFQQSPDGKINFATYYTHNDGEGCLSLAGYHDQWVHAVGVRQGSTKTLYIDGEPNQTGSCQGIYSGRDTKVFVGAIEDSSQQYKFFNGLIDDVRVYLRALDPNEVSELYQNGLSP